MSEPSLLEKYAGRKLPELGSEPATGEEDVTDDYGAFGWLRGTRERALMLELRRQTGDIVAIGYARLERVEFDPSVGITLHVLGQQIRLLGRNLNAELRPNVRLFQGITRHRVPWLQEADPATRLEAGAGTVLIERIAW